MAVCQPAGHVQSQQYPPGTFIEPGTPVDFVISLGPQPFNRGSGRHVIVQPQPRKVVEPVEDDLQDVIMLAVQAIEVVD